MKYTNKKIIGLTIMMVGIIFEIYGLFFNQDWWEFGVLVFLIGIVFESLCTHLYLKKYIRKYGDLE